MSEECLPVFWERVALGELVSANYGKSLVGGVRDSQGDVPVLGSSGVVGSHNVALVDRPCIVIGRKGSVGAVHLMSRPCWPIDTTYFVLAPDGLLLEYLAHQFGSLGLNLLDKSTAIPGLGRDDLYRVEFALAPMGEQKRIVDKLEELLSDLDAGVAELRTAQAKLKLYRQSLLKGAVTGELTGEWRKRQRLAGITPRRAETELHSSVDLQSDSALRALPEGWCWTCAEQFCGFITKGTTPPKELKGAGEEAGVPFLRVTNLTANGSLDHSDKVFVTEAVHRGFLKRSIVYPGDVLMNIVGPPLGQVSVVPASFAEWNVNQAIAIFRPTEKLTVSFLCAYLLSSVAQQWLQRRAKTTAGQTNLTLELCRNLPVPLPPLSEQHAITAILAEQLDALAMQEREVRNALRQSEAQRKNILQAAFSGRLVPQDPSDEPASVLLARIRASRADKASVPSRRPRKAKEPA